MERPEDENERRCSRIVQSIGYMKGTFTSILLIQALLLFIGLYMIDHLWWRSAVLLAMLMVMIGLIGSKSGGNGGT